MKFNSATGLMIYGAGPIDLGKDIPNWRALLMKKLEENEVKAAMFDPSTSYKLATFGVECDRRDAYIEFVNRQALEASDVMVVVIPKGVQTIGTPIEMEFARASGKAVILLTDIPRGKSVYLNNRVDAENWITIADLQTSEAALDAGLDYVVNNLLGVTSV